MKCKTVQVLWHEKGPVLSVDFNPASGLLASCGTDKEIKLWEVREDADGNPDVKHVDTLTSHTKAANVVRFSPGGDMLASGGDAGEVFVWKPGTSTNLHGDPTTWRTAAVMRGHSDDVQDLAWHPGGAALITGSVESTCIVWDVPKAQGVCRLEGHKSYVQGVCWDPQGEYLVSQSADRTVRLYASRGPPHPLGSQKWRRNMSCQKVLSKAEENADPRAVAAEAAAAGAAGPAGAAGAAGAGAGAVELGVVMGAGNDATAAAGGAGGKPAKLARQLLFHDDTMPSFFRRPAWSPCGSFLAAPAGIYREHGGAKEQHATYLYQRDCFARPALRLPGIAPAVCVRFSPVLYAHPGAPRGPSTPQGGGDAGKKAAEVANGKAAEAVERKTDGTEQEKAELKVEEIGEATPPTNAPGRLAQALHNEEMATHGDSVDTMTAAKTTTTVVAAAGTAAGGLEVAGGDAPTAEAEASISLEPAKAFDLPYRVIFCVCTTDTVAVYDTSEESPVAFVGGLHYAAITDAAWSPDGRTLVVSSSDGYCSVLSFTEAELGRALTPEEVPKHVREQLPERRVRAAEEAAREAVAAAARVAQARIAAAAHAAAAAAAAAAVAEAVSSAATATGEVTAAEAVPAAAAATATGVAARRIAPVPTGIDASTSASASARRMAPMPMSVDGGGGASASTAASSGAPRRIMPQPANASAPAADLSTPAPAASARRIAPQSMGAPVNAPVPVRLQPETTSPGEKRPRDVGAVQGETGAEETGASKSSKSGIAPTAC